MLEYCILLISCIYLLIFSTYFRFECLCLPGTTGIKCEIDINECESNPCQWGVCENKINGFTCACEDGYEGRFCETEINECERFKYD